MARGDVCDREERVAVDRVAMVGIVLRSSPDSGHLRQEDRPGAEVVEELERPRRVRSLEDLDEGDARRLVPTLQCGPVEGLFDRLERGARYAVSVRASERQAA